jgi:predicted flap endonuclease-1-like 5' DNA nuclease
MLRKFIYFGIGLASLLYENIDELVRTGEERYNELLSEDLPVEETVEIETVVSVEIDAEVVDDAEDTVMTDDLTRINGIGPTFAKRLQEGGITTYQALAELSEEQIRDITHAADWQADPNEWIIEAKAMV